MTAPYVLFQLPGHMIHHVKMGRVVQSVLHGFPALSLAASIQPITRTVLRVRLKITPEFEWNDKLVGGSSDPWWIWVEDPVTNYMYHSEYFMLQKKQVWVGPVCNHIWPFNSVMMM